MKESMRTAYIVAKNILIKRVPENEFLETAHVHIHVPEVNLSYLSLFFINFYNFRELLQRMGLLPVVL